MREPKANISPSIVFTHIAPLTVLLFAANFRRRSCEAIRPGMLGRESKNGNWTEGAGNRKKVERRTRGGEERHWE